MCIGTVLNCRSTRVNTAALIYHTLTQVITVKMTELQLHFMLHAKKWNTYVCVEKKSQLDATEWFIALIIHSTCFGHFYAHHQELETIRVITAYGVQCLGCWLLEVRCRAAGYVPRMRDVAWLELSNIPQPGHITCFPAPDPRQPATKHCTP